MPPSLLALAAGAFGIGTTEFIVMGLLTQVGADVGISIPTAGTLISRYAVGVVLGAPLLTIAKRHWPRKQLLMALMIIFIAGNAAADRLPRSATCTSACSSLRRSVPRGIRGDMVICANGEQLVCHCAH